MMVRRFTRVVPLQMDMLNLGGEVLSWGGVVPPTDRDRLSRMKGARSMLRAQTGHDFGYDLAAWHLFLLNHAELSRKYKFQTSWKAVRERMNELFNDPDRLRLVRLLEEEDPNAAADNQADP